MNRGPGNAPWWAWVVIAVSAVLLAVGVPLTMDRGQISADEVDRIQAEVDAENAAPAQPTLTRPTDRPLQVMFVGDSLTRGSYATSESLTFPALVTAGLEAGGEVATETVGRSGVMASEVMSEQLVADTAPADLVVVELGTNDVSRSTAQRFAVDFPALLDQIRERSPRALLLCAGPWEFPERAAPFEQVAQSACTQRGGLYVPLARLFADSSLHAAEGDEAAGGIAADDFHPNDAGHRAIADALLGVLG